MSEYTDAKTVNGLELVMRSFAWDVGVCDFVQSLVRQWKELGGHAMSFEPRCENGEGQVVLTFSYPPSKVWKIPLDMQPRRLRADPDGSVWFGEITPELHTRWRGPYRLEPAQPSDNHGALPALAACRFEEVPDLAKISAWIEAERDAALVHPAG